MGVTFKGADMKMSLFIKLGAIQSTYIPNARDSRRLCWAINKHVSTLLESHHLLKGQQRDRENAKRTKMFANKRSLF